MKSNLLELVCNNRMLRLLASNSLLTCSMSTRKDGSVERLYGVSPAGKFYVQNEDGGSMDSISSFACHRATVEVLYVYATYIATTPCMLSLMHI